MTIPSYVRGAEEPDLTATWLDDEGDLVDLSLHAFTLKLYKPGHEPVLIKTSGITGAATDPNIRVVWAVDELNIAPGGYRLEIKGTRAGSRDRFLEGQLLIRPTAGDVAAPPGEGLTLLALIEQGLADLAVDIIEESEARIDADLLKVAKAGDTMTGPLTLDRTAVAPSATPIFRVTGQQVLGGVTNEKLLAIFEGQDRADGSSEPMRLLIAHSNAGIQTTGYILSSAEMGADKKTPTFPNNKRFMLGANSDLGTIEDGADAAVCALFTPTGGVDYLHCSELFMDADEFRFRIRHNATLDQLHFADTGANVDLATFASKDVNITASSEARLNLWRYASPFVSNDLRGGQVVAINNGPGTVSSLVFRATSSVLGTQQDVLRLTGDKSLTIQDGAVLKVGAASFLTFAESPKVVTAADGLSIAVGSGTGLTIGTANTQKIAFFAASPKTQRPNTTDLRQVLIDFGFLEGGGVTPLNLNLGNLTATAVVLGVNPSSSGNVRLPNLGPISARNAANSADVVMMQLSATNDVTIAPNAANTVLGGWLVMTTGMNIRFGTTGAGTKICDGPTQLMGFWGHAAVVQPSGMPAAATDLPTALVLLNHIRANVLLGTGLAA